LTGCHHRIASNSTHHSKKAFPAAHAYGLELFCFVCSVERLGCLSPSPPNSRQPILLFVIISATASRHDPSHEADVKGKRVIQAGKEIL
jgi:hypothetical protein